MTNKNNHEIFNRLDNMIWAKRNVDAKGRTVLPVKLRKYLGLQKNSKILWIEVRRKLNKQNEFLVEIGVET